MTTETIYRHSAATTASAAPATAVAQATSATGPEGSDGADVPIIGSSILERAARVIRVLGHPLRLRMLEALEGGERNVTDLVAVSGATQALVSQHLAILRAEGVVGSRREGFRVFYRITEPKVHKILDCIRDCDLPEIDDAAAAALIDLPGDH